MGRWGIFRIKTIFSFIDQQVKSPADIANEWEDENQHKYYSRMCRRLLKEDLLIDLSVKTFKKEILKNIKFKSIKSGLYKYKLNLDIFIDLMIKLLEKLNNKNFSEYDKKILYDYYGSKYFKNKILPKIKAYHKIKPTMTLYDTIPYLSAEEHLNKKKLKTIKDKIHYIRYKYIVSDIDKRIDRQLTKDIQEAYK